MHFLTDIGSWFHGMLFHQDAYSTLMLTKMFQLLGLLVSPRSYAISSQWWRHGH